MGSCMENYPMENVATIGTAMTSKEKVLAIYPVTSMWHDNGLINVVCFSDDKKSILFFGGNFRTVEKAWDDAWDKIQKNLLWKLEQ
jgi:hypothetical protein